MTDFQQIQQNSNTVLELFSRHRRRYVLRGLRMYGQPMTLADLADEVATREDEAPLTEPSAEEVKRVYSTLSRARIPKLADEQFVRDDQERDSVALVERGEHVEQSQEFLAVE